MAWAGGTPASKSEKSRQYYRQCYNNATPDCYYYYSSSQPDFYYASNPQAPPQPPPSVTSTLHVLAGVSNSGSFGSEGHLYISTSEGITYQAGPTPPFSAGGKSVINLNTYATNPQTDAGVDISSLVGFGTLQTLNAQYQNYQNQHDTPYYFPTLFNSNTWAAAL